MIVVFRNIVLTSAEKAAKWKLAVELGVDKTISGVNELNSSPISSVVSAKELMKTKFLESLDSGYWEYCLLNGPNLEEWKTRTIQGWEKNRVISQDQVDTMVEYYHNLDNVILTIDDLVDYYMTPNHDVNAPLTMKRFFVKQLVSTALTKFQFQLKNKFDISECLPIIRNYLITKVGFVDGGTFDLQWFDPKSISNLELWLDLNDLDSITVDSEDNISQIDDKSGLNNHVTQDTLSKQPKLLRDFNNGKSVLQSNSLTAMDVPEAIRPKMKHDLEYTIIGIVTQDIASWGGLFAAGHSDNARWGFGSGNSDGLSMKVFNGSVWHAVGDTNNPSSSLGEFFATVVKSSTFLDTQLFRNDTEHFDDVHIQSNSHHQARFLNINSEQFGYQGKVAEFLFYSRKLTVNEIDSLLQSRYEKWGITP